jgi:hypothetical protein
MHLQMATVISVGAVATHVTTVLLLLQQLLALALLLSVLMLTLPLLRKTALLPCSAFSLTLTLTSKFEETWCDFVANMIRGKGAAAACAIVLNEEQFEACCGGINGKVNNHCCMEPTPWTSKMRKIQKIKKSYLVSLIHW